MKVILISGHAQHGKDTVAEMLRDHIQAVKFGSVTITHFADPLKFICREYFGWSGKKNETGRKLLQYVGTDVIRHMKPDFFVDFIGDIIRFFFATNDFVIIPDTRFPNEINCLKAKGFDVIHLRVERPGFTSVLTNEQMLHSSETALDNIQPDHIIVNDGTINELKAKTKKWAEEVFYAKL